MNAGDLVVGTKEGLDAAWRGVAAHAYFVSQYASISAAIADIDDTNVVLFLNAASSISDNLVIPSNIYLVAMQDGIITHSTYTITINGPFNAGRFQVFSGTGLVSFNSIEEVYPEWWGGFVGGTDCTAALMAAANSANGAYGVTVSLLPGSYTANYYRIDSLVTIDKDTVKFKGSSHRASVVKANAAEAGFCFSKGTGAVIYTSVLENVIFHGAGLSTVGLDYVNASEAMLINAGEIDCVTGIRLRGDYIPSSLKMNNPISSNNEKAFDLVNAADVQIYGPDFYDNDVVFDFTTCWRLYISGGWIEDFDNVFLFDHSSRNAIAYSVVADGIYYLSTRGTGTNSARIIKSYSDNNSYQTYCPSFVLSNSHLYLTNAKYIAEADWGSPHSYGPLGLKLENNHGMVLTNTDAWFGTDVTDNPIMTVRMDNNEFSDSLNIPATDNSNFAYVTINGYGYRGEPGYFATQASMTMDNAWHDWDFSSFLPFNAQVVHLSVTLVDATPGTYLLIRKKGCAGTSNCAICRTQVADGAIDFDVWVALDNALTLEYLASAAFDTAYISVRGWI